ncbi:MAG: TIGR03667 family PPOX class F420-dependent oxidoreductase [Chloroflexota bacterium]
MQIDTSTEFGQRSVRRLTDETIGWLTTVDANGTPQPSPIWFLWDGETAIIYSQPNTPKLRNIAANPRVSLHLDGNGTGGDIIILTGEARIDEAAPPSSDLPAYQAKYLKPITDGLKMTAESFAATYSVPIRFTPAKLRGF